MFLHWGIDSSPSPTPAARVATEKPRYRGFSHLLAFSSALTLAPLMIVVAPGVVPRFVIALYVLAIVGLFGISALFHRSTWSPRAHGVVRRLDHSMIFIAIAATYTPLAAFALPPASARTVLAVVWTGAIAGVVARVLWLEAPRWLTTGLYLAVGWAVLPFIGDVWRSLGAAGFTLLLFGGLLYTLGAIVYAWRRPDPWPASFGFHEVFHLFVVGGAASHYVVVAFFVLPLAAA